MHRRVLPREKWRWYGQDLALPLAAIAVTVGLASGLAPRGEGAVTMLAILMLSAAVSVVLAALAAPALRRELRSAFAVRLGRSG